MTTKAKKLRREGFVTGNLFGREMTESIPLQMDKRAVDKQVIKTACRSFEGIGSGAERCAAKADGDISFVSKGCVPYRECLFKKLHDFSSLFPFFDNIGSVQFILP